MNKNEIETMNKSCEALSKTLVGTKIVAMETRKNGNAKLVLSDGRVVMLRDGGACCAYGEVKAISDLITTEHAITRVEATEDGETWSIYSDDMTVGSIGVRGVEGTGQYGYGINIDVYTDALTAERVYNVDES